MADGNVFAESRTDPEGEGPLFKQHYSEMHQGSIHFPNPLYQTQEYSRLSARTPSLDSSIARNAPQTYEIPDPGSHQPVTTTDYSNPRAYSEMLKPPPSAYAVPNKDEKSHTVTDIGWPGHRSSERRLYTTPQDESHGGKRGTSVFQIATFIIAIVALAVAIVALVMKPSCSCPSASTAATGASTANSLSNVASLGALNATVLAINTSLQNQLSAHVASDATQSQQWAAVTTALNMSDAWQSALILALNTSLASAAVVSDVRAATTTSVAAVQSTQITSLGAGVGGLSTAVNGLGTSLGGLSAGLASTAAVQSATSQTLASHIAMIASLNTSVAGQAATLAVGLSTAVALLGSAQARASAAETAVSNVYAALNASLGPNSTVTQALDLITLSTAVAANAAHAVTLGAGLASLAVATHADTVATTTTLVQQGSVLAVLNATLATQGMVLSNQLSVTQAAQTVAAQTLQTHTALLAALNTTVTLHGAAEASIALQLAGHTSLLANHTAMLAAHTAQLAAQQLALSNVAGVANNLSLWQTIVTATDVNNDCSYFVNNSKMPSGVYTFPNGASVYCDFNTTVGNSTAWTLLFSMEQPAGRTTVNIPYAWYQKYFTTEPIWIQGNAEGHPLSPEPVRDGLFHLLSLNWSSVLVKGKSYRLRQRVFKGYGAAKTALFDVAYVFTYNGITLQDDTTVSTDRTWTLTNRTVLADSTSIVWGTQTQALFLLPFTASAQGTVYGAYNGYCSDYTWIAGGACNIYPEAETTHRFGQAGIASLTNSGTPPALVYAPCSSAAAAYDIVYSWQASGVFGTTVAPTGIFLTYWVAPM